MGAGGANRVGGARLDRRTGAMAAVGSGGASRAGDAGTWPSSNSVKMAPARIAVTSARAEDPAIGAPVVPDLE